MIGDRTMAEALRIAESWLIRQGWRFSPADVAKHANDILRTLDPKGTGA